MKFGFLALAAALSATAVAPAQAQQSPRQERPRAEGRAERMDPAKRVERRVQMLTQRLDLNADQSARVRTILTQESEQMKSFFEKNRAADGQRPTEEQRTAFRKEMQQVRGRTNAELVKVLNADQVKKYEELHKDRGHRGQRQKQGRGSART